MEKDLLKWLPLAFGHCVTQNIPERDRADVVGDAYAIGLKAFDPNRVAAIPSAFLWDCLRTVARKYRRPCRTLILMEDFRAHEQETADLSFGVAEQRTPLDELLSYELKSILGRCLRKLPASDRELLIAVHLNGCPLETFAREKNLYPGTAKSRAHRARRKLRDLMDSEFKAHKDPEITITGLKRG